ncbi:MmcQ/YjbR family DNA-binding protein [Streptococcus castoreus]|uniref:MmcQ/YjbR family DNA-binding protein n=1 Tax=Streptococcus castoreus TaxID=254786 RepID=UPI000410ED6E|nr:MmcQ/YjbR family DNA-binding protein [Streptococcus castoreus]
MHFVSDYFSHKFPLFEQLLAYGFEQQGNDYIYKEQFMAGEFEAQIRIDQFGKVSSRVIDCDLGDDYLPLKQGGVKGNYTGQVKAAYLALLDRLSEACFVDKPFRSDQANWLADRIVTEWSDPMDYPFDSHPDFATYRVVGKWYAMIFPLLADKLGHVPDDLKGKTVEVINLKVSPKNMSNLLEQEGIYPAYHMSKKTWISLLLGGTISDEKLWELVANSRQLAHPNGFTNPNGSDYWVIPANLKYYDIDAEFAVNDDILWTQKASIATGDFVLIYITAPTKSIRYACQVLETNIPNQGYRKTSNVDKLMRLRKCHYYEDGLLSFELMKAYGVNAVRGPRRLSPQLIAFLKEKEYLKDTQSKR